MFNASDVVHLLFWPALILIGIAAITVVLVVLFGRGGGEADLSNYIRKPYLFDSRPEFELFKTLVELFQDRYFVFPQVHYIHLIQPRKGLSHAEWFGLRSRIDKKSADFVLCDKNQVIPQLIIELDGPTHELPERQKRDAFINELTKIAGLKILRIKVGSLDKEGVKNAVETVLKSADSAK